MLNAQTLSILFLPTNRACSDDTSQCLGPAFHLDTFYDFSGCVTTSPPPRPQTRKGALVHREVVGAGDMALLGFGQACSGLAPWATGGRSSEVRLGVPCVQWGPDVGTFAI